jgi:membrane-bound ClpP family serine protease
VIQLLLAALGMLAEPPVVVPPARLAKSVAVLPVRGEMDAITVAGLADRVAWSRQAGADAVVLAFDTPGGEMLSTLELCRQIKSEYPANTVAWIAPRAFSAGTIAALACREIVVTPDAVFGDAAPIAVLPGLGLQSLPPAERAKLEAPVLSEVTDSARRRRHDERLCHAFVRTGAAAWLLEDPEQGERFVVDAEEYEAIFGVPPPAGVTDARPRSPMKLIPWITDALRRPGSGNGLDAATQDAIDAMQSLPPGRQPLGSADADRLQLVSRIDGPDTLLTLRADEAVALGMATAVIQDQEGIRRFLGADSLFVVEPRWSETAARFLTSWWLRTLLVLVIVVCFVIEMFTPGLGAFAIAGATAAAVLVAGPMLAGLADWWPAVLLVAGLALVAVEVLLLPGSLAAGIAGVLCFAVGTVGLFVVSSPSPQPQHAVVQGLGTLVAAVAAALATVWWLGRSGGLARGSVLEASITSLPPRSLPPAGAEGVATTDLRPSGRVEIAGALHEATASGWIDRGTPIRVIDAASDVLRVEALP